MVLLALFAALVCLILGLIFASGPWLIGSLAASALAAIVLWRQREQRPRGTTARPPDGGRKPIVTGSAVRGSTAAATADEAASPARHRSRPMPGGADETVWVVDGRPDFHERHCGRLAGANAEAIPLSQARSDGFAECASCRPVAGSTKSVWVVDGRPRYHLETCMIIQDQDAEMIPLEQAVEDGFMPCSMCEPFVSRV